MKPGKRIRKSSGKVDALVQPERMRLFLQGSERRSFAQDGEIPTWFFDRNAGKCLKEQVKSLLRSQSPHCD